MVSLYEGFGLPLVESTQWGVPLIASSSSSIAEVAGDAALLVDPSDTDAIAQSLRRISVVANEETRWKLEKPACGCSTGVVCNASRLYTGRNWDVKTRPLVKPMWSVLL